jgi:serine phosphatase RsbU (regulator of sigma subunit)/CHASE3 domain sensor protein
VRPVLLRRRLLLLFVVVVLGVAILGGLARTVVRSRDDTAAHGRTVRVAREQVERLRAAYAEQENGERGFVISGENDLLAPYTDGRREANRVVRSLRGISHEIKEIGAPLGRVVASAEAWRAQAAEPEIELARSGDRDAALASIASGEGSTLFDRVRANLDTLDRRVAAIGVTSDDRAASTRRQLTFLVVLFIVLLFVGTLVAAWLIRRWVTRPIDRLVVDVRRVRGGDLDAPIRSTGPPEIAELADDIEEMRRSLDEQRIDAERAREAVEQNAAVVLALRSQLEPEIGELPKGWTIAAQLRAAEGVAAGDCYDLVRLHGGALGLIVVDIAGHGATEGILALRCKELLRASLAADVSPGEAIEAAAEQLGDMGPEVFLTAFVAVVDTEDGRVSYANAGHPPAFISSEDSDFDLAPTGPLVGPLLRPAAPHWGTSTATIAPNDNLCIYTDGLIEIRNAEREFFGPERLQALIRGSRCDQAPNIVKRCLDEAQLFAGGRMHDDATIVVLCRPKLDSSTVAGSG